MKFKDIIDLISPTKNIGVVLKDKTAESYTVLYLGIASKMPVELGEYELIKISISLIETRKAVLTIEVK